MKSVAVLALAGAASAQISLYVGIASAVNKQIDALDAAIKAYTSGDGSAVIASASGLLSVVNSGSAAAAKGQTIDSFNQAILLLEPYQAVAASVKKVVGDLDDKFSVASKNNLGGVAYTLLQSESAAAVGLANVITGKITGAASLARGIAQTSIIIPITSAINSGIAVYSPIKDQKQGGGSGSSSSDSDSSSSTMTSSGSDTTTTSESSSTTDEPTPTDGGSGASTSSSPPQFTGNSAAGLQVGAGLAAAAGALAYIL